MARSHVAHAEIARLFTKGGRLTSASEINEIIERNRFML